VREETQIQRSIKAYLETLGYKVVHVPNGSVLSGDKRKRSIQMASLKRDGLCVGFPDLIVYGPGKIGHIEVKREGEFASDEQMAVEQWLSDFGFLYAVCRSIDDVQEALERWGWVHVEIEP